jgi:hypothetical protein
LSKTVRVYIVVAVLAAVGLFVGVQVVGSALVGIVIAVVAAVGGLYLLNRETSDGDGFFSAPKDRVADDDDEEVDDVDDDEPAPPRSTPKASTATAQPLATWEGEGLTPWTPPEAEAEAADEIELDASDLEELDRIDDFFDSEPEAETRTEELSDVDLDELLDTESAPEDEYDAFDPDAFSKSSFRDSLVPADEIDEHDDDDMFDDLAELEDVHTDDDIMKASDATSLEVTGAAGGDNSELAKLLAKVQSRLAAYE